MDVQSKRYNSQFMGLVGVQLVFLLEYITQRGMRVHALVDLKADLKLDRRTLESRLDA